jgi:hypothetical protein
MPQPTAAQKFANLTAFSQNPALPIRLPQFPEKLRRIAPDEMDAWINDANETLQKFITGLNTANLAQNVQIQVLTKK